MAQTELNRLLILPAIVLAATLSLTGCSNLPFFGGDSDSSNNSSSRDDDEDDEDEEEEEEEEDDNSGSGGCPQKFLDQATTDGSLGDSGLDNVKVTEIAPSDFEPASVGDVLGEGCIFILSYSQDGEDAEFYEAFIPGGDDVVAQLDEALVADGYDGSSGEGFYIGDDNSFVAVYANEDSGFTEDEVQEYGLDFLGDEFLVVTAYKGEV